MNSAGNATRRAAIGMLLVLIFIMGISLSPPVSAGFDDPPPSDQDTSEQAGIALNHSEQTFTPRNVRAPQGYSLCTNPSLSIPDNDPNGANSTIVVSSAQFVADMDVYVDVSHTWVGDLVVTLEHVETGTSVTIIDRPGSPGSSALGCSGNSIDATLDDEAATPVEDECAVGEPTISGSFVPNNPLSAFDNVNVVGTWRLTVSDHAAGDVGTLNEWCLVGEASVGYAVDSDGTDHLWMINLSDGDATDIGPVGFGSVEALAFAPDGRLYGVDDVTEELITINLTTGAGTAVGALGAIVNDVGLAFDVLGNLWMVDDGSQTLYSVNRWSGQATLIGSLGQKVTGLTARGMALYGLGGDGTDNLVTINTGTGAATTVGALVNVSVSDGGLDFDAHGTLWGISDTNPDTIFTIDSGTGTATVATTLSGVSGIENLAIPPAAVAYAVESDGSDHLWLIYLHLGVAIDVGPVNYNNVEALAFSPDGVLYGVDDTAGQQKLVTIDLTTGAGTEVGPLGVSVMDVGLAFDMAGNLWMVDDWTWNLYSVNPDTGQATVVGSLGQKVTGLTARGMTLYGLGGDNTDNLLTINTATGAATSVGSLVNVTVNDGGLDFDRFGTLWGISDTNPDTIFTIDPATGEALEITTALGMGGIEGMAILVAPRQIYLPLVLSGF